MLQVSPLDLSTLTAADMLQVSTLVLCTLPAWGHAAGQPNLTSVTCLMWGMLQVNTLVLYN